MTTPSSVAESFFMKNLPFTRDNRAEPLQVMFSPAELRLLSDLILGADNLNLA